MKALKKVRLAGVTFGKCQENIRKWGKKETGSYTLVREPDNPHDKYAIGVFYRRYQLGYIPKDEAAKLALLMDSGKHFTAKFVQLNTFTMSKVVGLTVEIIEAEI
jgi:hypothetical protein